MLLDVAISHTEQWQTKSNELETNLPAENQALSSYGWRPADFSLMFNFMRCDNSGLAAHSGYSSTERSARSSRSDLVFST